MTKKTIADLISKLAERAKGAKESKAEGIECEEVHTKRDVDMLIGSIVMAINHDLEMVADIAERECGCKVALLKVGPTTFELGADELAQAGDALLSARFTVDSAQHSIEAMGLASKLLFLGNVLLLRSHTGVGHDPFTKAEGMMFEAFSTYVDDLLKNNKFTGLGKQMAEAERAVDKADFKPVIEKYGIVTETTDLSGDLIRHIADGVRSLNAVDSDGVAFVGLKDGVATSGPQMAESTHLAVTAMANGKATPIFVAEYGGAIAKVADAVEADLVERDLYDKNMALPLVSMRLTREFLAAPPKSMEEQAASSKALIEKMTSMIGPDELMRIMKTRREAKEKQSKTATHVTKETKFPTFH